MISSLSDAYESQLVRQAVEQWPEVPSRSLARKLVKDNPKVFGMRDLERVRDYVRYYRGKAGTYNRKARQRAGGTAVQLCPSVPHDPTRYIAPTDATDFLPHVISHKRGLKIDILGDLHFPYHDPVAIQVALDDMDRDPPDLIILNGDILDFYKLSRFMKSPLNRDTVGEIDYANEFLDMLDLRYPNAKKIWKDGNHDERLSHYLMSQAPELFDLASEFVNLRLVMELDKRGYDYVTEKRPIHAGKLTILHGHEYPTPVLGPVNAARGLFLRTMACALVHHHHQVSEHSQPDVRDALIATWSVGCLCGLHPEYARFNKWAHGYARVNLDTDGSFQVTNHKIYKGRLLS